jgi:hypothetical protein
LGVWDVCCMYQDLSEKGVIVDRLDLECDYKDNSNNSGNPNEMPLRLLTHGECEGCVHRKEAPLSIKSN